MTHAFNRSGFQGIPCTPVTGRLHRAATPAGVGAAVTGPL